MHEMTTPPAATAVHRLAIAGALWACMTGPAGAADASSDAIPTAVASSVVKIFTKAVYPDLAHPWSKQSPHELTGSGVIVDGNRILTNAHVVLYANDIQVQANEDGDKVPAKVLALAPGIDLAVLRVDDQAFFRNHAPLARSHDLPRIKDAVYAYGFPTGGSALSVTKGIVSRIEFVLYHPFVSGLRLQIDAAINPGNSGGPAVIGDKMVGLAFSHLKGAENIGYVIPNEEIELFLQDVADGHYDGKPAIHDDLQTLENPNLRKFLKLTDSVHGIVVHHPDPPESALKEWDVITRIGDVPIDDQGMIKLDQNIRVSFRYWVQRLAQNGSVSLGIVRDGREQTVRQPVSSEYPRLLSDLTGSYPAYFIFGPLTFEQVSMQGLENLTAEQLQMLIYMRSPLVTQRVDPPSKERDELVLIPAPFFSHPLAKGYGNPMLRIVDSINGIRIRNLKHLVAVLRDLKDDYVTIATDTRAGETYVFPRKEMAAATEDVLRDNDVRSQGSADVMAIWHGAALAGN